MIPESKLKADCTPEIIKKMVELAEGFEFYENEDGDKYYSHKESAEWIPILVFDPVVFPLLIHRAVEELEYVVNQDKEKLWILLNNNDFKIYPFNNYQPQSLTPCECACLHCLIEVLK
jgi:hypothetical protein